MKKLLVGLTLLSSMSAFASDLYKCELSRANENGIDQTNISTGWIKADTVGNTLNLQAIGEVSGVAVQTPGGLRVSLCDSNECIFTDLVLIGEYAGLSTKKKHEGYRVSIECNIY